MDPRIIVLDTTAGHIVNAQTLVTWLVQYMKSADVSKHPVHRLHTHRLGGYYLQSEKKPEESQVSKVMMLPLASREGSFPGFRRLCASGLGFTESRGSWKSRQSQKLSSPFPLPPPSAHPPRPFLPPCVCVSGFWVKMA